MTLRILFWSLVESIGIIKYIKEILLTEKEMLMGQVDSPESPEITEIIENFIKMTKDFTKLKDTLTNYVWEKSHFKKL